MKSWTGRLSKKLLYRLGSIPFALLLIASTALMVIVGTILESKTDSHRQACFYTYESAIFSALLTGFFINILVSALLRWPFKVKHIPFLITHLGLLMVIAGQLAKKHYGTQGFMSLVEGSAADTILLPNSYAVAVESAKGHVDTAEALECQYFPLKPQFGHYSALKSAPSNLASQLKITLLNFIPNMTETLESWIKEEHFSIYGEEPLEIEREPISPHFKRHAILAGSSSLDWNLKGIESDDLQLLKQLYVNNVSVQIKESFSEKKLAHIPLNNLLQQGLQTLYGTVTAKLNIEFDSEKIISPAELTLHVQDGSLEETISISLSGTEALCNRSSHPLLGNPSLTFDLVARPTLLLIRNAINELFFFGWTAHGEIIAKTPLSGSEGNLMAYGNGFGGYSREVTLHFHPSRQKQEEHAQNRLKLALEGPLDRSLSPPLELLRNAAQKCEVDFPRAAVDFLSSWHSQGGWLHAAKDPLPESLASVVQAIDWHALPTPIYRGCARTVRLFDLLTPELKKGENIWAILQARGYPLTLFPHRKMELEAIFQAMTHHMFSLPNAHAKDVNMAMPKNHSLPQALKLLSAYFRAYGIHYSENGSQVENTTSEYVTLETKVTRRHKAAARRTKLETETPGVLLRIEEGSSRELVSLSFDPSASGLKWPALGGKYLLRFQPMVEQIPHHLRLREARQISYAHSQQPYSYESDLLIRENKGPREIEKTISMNVVHETPDGYRFYLANISNNSEEMLKRVQIIVNRDPAKYLLTYFGGAITVLGILLLFAFRPYRQNHGLNLRHDQLL